MKEQLGEQLVVGMLVYIDMSSSTWSTALDAQYWGRSSLISEDRWMRDVYLVVEPIYVSNPGPYIMAYKVLCGETYSYVLPYVRFKKA